MTNTIAIWWRLLRGRNLLIVALTQYLLQYLILAPIFTAAGITPALGGFRFFLFALTTVLIAAGGYLINDLEDQAIDARNKPDRYVVGRLVARSTVWVVYVSCFWLGAILSVYLAFYVDNPPLALIFPAAYGLLFWYSRRLKKLPFWGNLTVAVYCAVVAGIILFAERIAFQELWVRDFIAARKVAWLFGIYLAFAFLATLWREIIKDLEDREGDAAEGCRTLPIVIGERGARRFARWVGIGLIVVIALGILLLQNFLASQILLTSGALVPAMWLNWRTAGATLKPDYSRVSSGLKLLMLVGLLLLFAIRWDVLV